MGAGSLPYPWRKDATKLAFCILVNNVRAQGTVLGSSDRGLRSGKRFSIMRRLPNSIQAF
jgi:hypothetical protein